MPSGHPFPPDIRLEKRREYKRLWQRKYLAAHQTAIKERKKAAYHANKDKESLIHKVYYQLNKERIKAKSRANYRKNKAAHLAKAKEWAKAHPEQVRLYGQTYYEKNAAIINKKTLAYMAAHPEMVQQQQQRRRARKANAPLNDLTAAQWREIQEAQDHRCYYCGKRCKGHLTQDHILPLSKGGSHTVMNVIGACKSCNSKKFTGAPPIPVQPFLLTIATPKKKKAA